MKLNIRYILEFYGTIGIPLLYFFVLYSASLGDTISIPTLFRLFGLILSVLGLGFWLLSYLHLGRGFGVLPKSQKKVTRGLYSRYHHPMYIGITFTFFGLALANQSFAGLIATLLLLLPVLIIRAKLEEKKLHD